MGRKKKEKNADADSDAPEQPQEQQGLAPNVDDLLAFQQGGKAGLQARMQSKLLGAAQTAACGILKKCTPKFMHLDDPARQKKCKRISMVLLAATCGVLYSTGMSSVLQEQYEANIAKHLVNATNVTQDEAPPAVDPNSAVASAAAGVLLGPLLLLYGYRVQPTIVVLNSFIASGMVHFFEMVNNLEQWNQDISGGKFDPANLLYLMKVLLSSFTISTTALKVRPFNAAMRGGVSVNVFLENLLHQVPPLFGCECDGWPCGPLIRGGMYAVEQQCYLDRWFRFAIRYSIIGSVSYIATKMVVIVIRINVVMVGANLCCQVIFDSALAAWPDYGSYIQPYRLAVLGFLTWFGFKSQTALEQIDEHVKKIKLAERGMDDGDASTNVKLPKRPPGLWFPWFTMTLHRVAPHLLRPLMLVDSVFNKLKTIGNKDLNKELHEEMTGLSIEKAAADRKASKAERLQGLAQTLQKHSDKEISRIRRGRWCRRVFSRFFVLLLNAAIFCVCVVAVDWYAKNMSPQGGFDNLANELLDGADPRSLHHTQQLAVLFMVVAAFMMIVSFVGLCAAISERISILLLYSFIVFTCATAQAIGVASVYNQQFMQSTDSFVLQRIGEILGRNPGCSTTVLPYNLTNPDPNPQLQGILTVQCSGDTDEPAAWLREVTNDRCVYYDQRHVNASKMALSAIVVPQLQTMPPVATLRAKSTELEARLVAASNLMVCLHTYNGTHPMSVARIYCACKTTLGDNLRRRFHIAAAFAVTLMVLEYLMCSMCFFLIAEKRHRNAVQKRARILREFENQGGKAKADTPSGIKVLRALSPSARLRQLATRSPGSPSLGKRTVI